MVCGLEPLYGFSRDSRQLLLKMSRSPRLDGLPWITAMHADDLGLTRYQGKERRIVSGPAIGRQVRRNNTDRPAHARQMPQETEWAIDTGTSIRREAVCDHHHRFHLDYDLQPIEPTLNLYARLLCLLHLPLPYSIFSPPQ